MNFTAIAIGTGPSFYRWIDELESPPACVRYGCGVASKFIDLDVYCINSGVHRGNIPAGVPTFSRMRTMDYVPGGFLWPESWPIASQVGGMCVQLAALNHLRVGLIGFDGPIEPRIDGEFREILRFWIKKGRVFTSLMERSAFDDLLVTE